MTEPENTNLALRSWKVRFALLLTFLVGLAITAVALYKESNKPEWPEFLDWVPLLAIGETLISASIIGFVFEMFVRRENERSINHWVEGALKRSSGELAKSLTLEALTSAASVDRLSADQRTRVLKEVLVSWTGDRNVASEVERVLLPEFSRGRDYWRDVRYDLQLQPDSGDTDEAPKYIEALISCEYEAVLERPTYIARIGDEGSEPYDLIDTKQFNLDYALSFGRTLAYEWSEQEHFGYSSIEIDQYSLNLSRRVVAPTDSRPGYVETTGDHEGLASVVGTAVRHRISAYAKLPKRGHYFSFPLIHTAVGLECRVQADTQVLGIQSISMVPFLQGGGAVHESRGQSGRRYQAQVKTSRTVLAGSGVVVTWNLRGEYDESFNFVGE